MLKRSKPYLLVGKKKIRKSSQPGELTAAAFWQGVISVGRFLKTLVLLRFIKFVGLCRRSKKMKMRFYTLGYDLSFVSLPASY